MDSIQYRRWNFGADKYDSSFWDRPTAHQHFENRNDGIPVFSCCR